MNFDRVAPVYQRLEYAVFGHALQRARVRWLNEIGEVTRCLIIGEGDGRFISQLARKYPHLTIDCVEASAGMIKLAQRRLQSMQIDASSVRFIQEDIGNWTPAGPYDLVVTHFFLDCFGEEELDLIVGKIVQTLELGGIWLVADFVIPRHGWAKWYGRFLVFLMYRFFRIVAGLKTNRLVDPTPILAANDLRCLKRDTRLGGVVRSDVWARR